MFQSPPPSLRLASGRGAVAGREPPACAGQAPGRRCRTSLRALLSRRRLLRPWVRPSNDAFGHSSKYCCPLRLNTEEPGPTEVKCYAQTHAARTCVTGAFSPGDPHVKALLKRRPGAAGWWPPRSRGSPRQFLLSWKSWHCEQRDIWLWISDGKHWPTGLVNNTS